jgi:hypothetical protein
MPSMTRMKVRVESSGVDSSFLNMSTTVPGVEFLVWCAGESLWE